MSNKQKLKLRLLSKRKAESKLFDRLFSAQMGLFLDKLKADTQRRLDLGCYKIYGGCKGGGGQVMSLNKPEINYDTALYALQENVVLAMQLLKQEFERMGIVLYAAFDYKDLIPLPTQTRKVRILNNGE